MTAPLPRRPHREHLSRALNSLFYGLWFRYHDVPADDGQITVKFSISPVEARVLGCLIEKEATTPDVYPLTANSLLAACNQKSSREPVMALDNDQLMTAMNSLIDRTLASTWQFGRNRTVKYQHKLRHRVSDEFDFSLPELAVVCVLLLRGPQTIGEIRSRSARIHEFENLDAIATVLQTLEQDTGGGPYVTMLAREEGRKESRYAHLFCGDVDETILAVAAPERSTSSDDDRLQALVQEVGELRAELNKLEQRFEDFRKQFE